MPGNQLIDSAPFPAARTCQLLLQLSDALIEAHDLTGLMGELKNALRPLTPSDFFVLYIQEKGTDRMIVHVIDAESGEHSMPSPDKSASELPVGEVMRTLAPLVVGDWELESRWPSCKPTIREYGARSCAILPLMTARGCLGGMAFYSRRPESYADPRDVETLSKVASQIAVAVENVLHLERAEKLGAELKRERDRLRLLLELTNVTVTQHDLMRVFQEFSKRLRPEMDLRFTILTITEPHHGGRLVLFARDMEMDWGGMPAGTVLDKDHSVSNMAIKARQIVVLNHAELSKLNIPAIQRMVEKGIHSLCSIPLIVADRIVGVLLVGTSRDHAFDDPDSIELLKQAGAQLAIAADNAMAFQQIEELKIKLSQEKLYLEDEVWTEGGFDEIVGQSRAIREVLAEVEVVAGTDSTVLISGETGTGKELIARAIHRLSPRRERTFVKVNCAAIPPALLESELFGHEKGAFTGAVAQRIGRFELADGGTLFLDEIGDLPLELQPKLLRVLQEQEFERLGGSNTVKTDVRIVAATNRDLSAMVRDRQFREDLFYRVNVFPIPLPPLRQRLEDVSMLVKHFAHRLARKANRRIEHIPAEAIEAMKRYSWPGNLRELQNFVERAVIRSRGPTLDLPVAELRETEAPRAAWPEESAASLSATDISKLDAVQRDHIIQVLRESRWVIWRTTGAAVKLGIKRTTLQSRMRRLRIERPN